MTLVKDEPLGEKSFGPAHCICRQEAVGKERELLIVDSAPGSVFSSHAGNEKEICVRESKKNRREKKRKNRKKKNLIDLRQKSKSRKV